MKTIELHLPPDAVQIGELCDNYLSAELDQDIIEISLSSGVTIEAGWYPEYDPTGRFQITVFRDCWEHRLMPPVSVKSVHELAMMIEYLSCWYSAAPAAPLGGSGVTQTNTSSTAAQPIMAVA